MHRRPALAVLAVTIAVGALTLAPTSAAPKPTVIDGIGYGFQGEEGGWLPERDYRVGRLAPTAAQREAAEALGADGVRWNIFGTPSTLLNHDGYLTERRSGSARDIARQFVRDNAAIFGLTAADAARDRLELVTDTPLRDAKDLRRMIGRQKPLNDDVGHVVLFQQRFGAIPTAGAEGQISVAVDKHGRVSGIGSSLTNRTKITNEQLVSAVDALVAASADVRESLDAADVTLVERRDRLGYTTFRIPGTPDLQRAKLVAYPTPLDGVRLAWETIRLKAHPDEHGHPEAYTHYVDAATGKVLYRNNNLRHFSGGGPAVRPQANDNPSWAVFENAPDFPIIGEDTPDTRVLWCWAMATGCHRSTGHDVSEMRQTATPEPYDVAFDPSTGAPVVTFQTRGNNAETAGSYFSHLTPDAPVAPISPTREYTFPFTDQWHKNSCSPTNFVSPQRNDLDAATVNLFVMHNRMHDWAYFLGFTETTWNLQLYNFGEDRERQEGYESFEPQDGDPETGQAQAGAVAGGVAFLGRDNANQITLPDGQPGITNQYLWHPLQAGFYSACVDGAYDMAIIAHEVGHAIQNRMTAGPTGDLDGHQAGAMGESWSDLTAIEYLHGYGFEVVGDEHPYAMAAYATGSKLKGIRNYNMSESPLNYSNLEYDGNGTTSPHADGEIWSATNFDLRQAMMEKWQSKFDANDKDLQYRCADGNLNADECPGNRRWVQIMHDAFLIQPGSSSMLDARDAQLLADKTRFEEADQHQDLMWDVYAKRGLGNRAETGSSDDVEASPGFDSPQRNDEAQIKFKAKEVAGGGLPEAMNVFVGHYEARITPVATTAGGATSPAVPFIAGTYDFVVQAPGYGHIRFTETFKPGESRTVEVPLRRNHASATFEAEVTGDGGNHQFVNDDTEGSNWAYLGPSDTETSIVGKQFTVALAGGRQLVNEVNVSAANRPALCDTATGDNPLEVVSCSDDNDMPYDPNAQNRFAALRAFEILVCDATTGADCESDDGFTVLYTSEPDAFPSGRPRPLAPDLKLQSFDVPDAHATHVRLRVVSNQCTGNPIYSTAQNPNADPVNNPDCVEGFVAAPLASTTATNRPTIRNTQRHRVRVAELQVFSQTADSVLAGPSEPDPVPPPPPPVVDPPKQPRPPAPLPSTGLAVPLLWAAVVTTVAVALRRRRDVSTP